MKKLLLPAPHMAAIGSSDCVRFLPRPAAQSSSSLSIAHVRLPLLCLSALDDPIAPAAAIPYKVPAARDRPAGGVHRIIKMHHVANVYGRVSLHVTARAPCCPGPPPGL